MVIQTINTSGCCPQTIVIGRRGTYDTMQIAFDLSYLVESFGNGVAVLAVKRSQDSSAYPAVVTQEDNTLTWTVSETDTAYAGAGECQLMWYVVGGLAKTIIYPMVVMRDILATSEDAPDAYQNWIESLTALGAETLQNAQDAAQSASDAEDAKDDAVTAKEAAESAQQAAETAVTHYPKIENNYWMVWDSTSQSYVSTGIQAEGEDGYSPEVTITSIEGGHRVTITDKDHPQGQSFDVLDGQGGGGTSDYTDLTNKPSINNITLTGNKTAADLGLATPSDIPTVPVQSVAGKTGAVTLNANDVAFSESGTYDTGTVGAELSQQKNAIEQKQDAPQTAGTAGQVLGLDSNLHPAWVDQTGGGGKRLLGEVVVPNGVLIYPQSIDLETGIITFSDLSNIPESISAYGGMMALTKLDKAAPINTLPTELVSATLGIHKISDTTAYLRVSGGTDITSYASSQTIDLTKWAFEVHAIGISSIQVSGLELKNHMYFELYSPATQQEDVSMSLRLVDSNGTRYLRAGSVDGFRPYYGGDPYSMLSYRTMPVTNGGKAGITFTGIWLPAWYKLDVRKKDDFILVESDTSVAVENSAANAGRYVRDIQSFVLANNGISAITAHAANSFGAFPGGSCLRVWEVLD